MKDKLNVSERLQKIATFIPEGSTFADIGSDHAYLPCYVCMKDPLAHGIAGEVSRGPFSNAKETVQHYQLKDRVDVRLGDGLSVIDEQLDTVIIAGMGGSLIAQIIEDGKAKLRHINRFILQPNTNAAVVRKTLLKHQFALVQEEIIEENHHIYEVLVAEQDSTVCVYTPDEDIEKQLMFGPLLMQEKSEIFMKKWEIEKGKMKNVLKQMQQAKTENNDKVNEFRNQLKWMEEVLK